MHAQLGTLGEIVSWRSPAHVRFADLKAALSGAGLDDELAKDMLPRHAFSRAAKQLEEGRIIRKVEEDDSSIEFQFTREYLVSGEYQYTKETTVQLDKASGAVTCPNNELETLAQSLLYDEMAKRRSNDITRIIQRVFEAYKGDLISIREQGGVYFVPSHHEQLVDNVDTLLSQIGGKLRRFRVSPDGGSTSESVAESMHEHFASLIEEFKQSCLVVTEDSSPEVAQRRTQTLIELRLKLDAYKDLLRDYAENIETGLDDADKLLTARITGEEPSEPEPELAGVGGGAMTAEQLLMSILDV